MPSPGPRQRRWGGAATVVLLVAVGGVFGVVAAGAGVLALGYVPVVVAVVAIAAAVMLLWWWWRRSTPVVRGFVVGLAAGWVGMIGLAGWSSNVGPSDPGPKRTEAKLRQIASTTRTPIYYLGSSFHGERLEDAVVTSEEGEVVGDNTLDPGQGLLLIYGETCGHGPESMCSPTIAFSIEPANSGLARECTRRGTLRGVPAVSTNENVILLTGDVLVLVSAPPSDRQLADDAAKAIRLVGQAESNQTDLPPPSDALLKNVARWC